MKTINRLAGQVAYHAVVFRGLVSPLPQLRLRARLQDKLYKIFHSVKTYPATDYVSGFHSYGLIRSKKTLLIGRVCPGYFCYCAYVLRISRYSGFLWVVPTNTGIFLCGLKLCGESVWKHSHLTRSSSGFCEPCGCYKL